MITIKVPLDAILDWFTPTLLVLIGGFMTTLGILTITTLGGPVLCIGGIIFLIPGILWVLSMLNIVRFESI